MDQHIFTVTAVTQLLKEVIEQSFPRLTIEGEVSNFRPSSAGHWYFTLKDASCAISAVMFKNRNLRVRPQPKDGQKVRATGTISVYEVRGTYQIICEELTPVGQGDILQMLEQRKQAFLQEGLFDETRKKPLPLLPKHITVITSSTGAALRDILSVLRRRNAHLRVSILPVTVQGERAAGEIATMIRYAGRWNLGDVIIVGRGGGSIEDLLPFSEEIVIRAAAASRIPIISAVGHETDWSLLDYAADLRAPTPSAAAERVTAEQKTLGQRIRQVQDSLAADMRGALKYANSQAGRFSPDYLRDPIEHRIRTGQQHLDELRESLRTAITRLTTDRRHKIEMHTHTLSANSPREILRRGYAVVLDAHTNAMITSAETTEPGIQTRTVLKDGVLNSTVDAVNKGEPDGEL
ncbi:MAG: exodeoxyribonuclease VII large subunit [Spirochaetota bacterium]